MGENEYYSYNDRIYVDPNISKNQQLAFVNQLRDTMGKNTAQINSQTQALGTNVPSSLGGLTGSNSYFTQRYQTTPVQAQTATLKATAQAKALNDLMTNYQNQAANRYQQAYRNAYAKASVATTADETTENPLQITTNGGGIDDTTMTVSTTDWQNQIGKLNSEPNGQLYYLQYQPQYKDPVKVYVNNLTSGDDLLGRVRQLGTGTNGQVKNISGTNYIYLDTGQLAPSWYRMEPSLSTSLGD